jgi:SHS2 domain-containing protein
LQDFEILDHTADVAIRIAARSEAGLLHGLADAIRTLYVGEVPLEAGRQLEVHVTGGSREELLVRFANELIFLFDSQGSLATRLAHCDITTNPNGGYHAALVLGLCDCKALALPVETDLKAATYHALQVTQDRDGLMRATMVIDT